MKNAALLASSDHLTSHSLINSLLQAVADSTHGHLVCTTDTHTVT